MVIKMDNRMSEKRKKKLGIDRNTEFMLNIMDNNRKNKVWENEETNYKATVDMGLKIYLRDANNKIVYEWEKIFSACSNVYILKSR
jgi:Tfp pilus assembly ATPase PilU